VRWWVVVVVVVVEVVIVVVVMAGDRRRRRRRHVGDGGAVLAFVLKECGAFPTEMFTSKQYYSQRRKISINSILNQLY